MQLPRKGSDREQQIKSNADYGLSGRPIALRGRRNERTKILGLMSEAHREVQISIHRREYDFIPKISLIIYAVNEAFGRILSSRCPR